MQTRPSDDDGSLIRVRTWRFLPGEGLERCELRALPDGWMLRGTLVMHDEGRSAEAAYTVSCDGSWRTRAAKVRVRDASGERNLDLRAEDGRWLANGSVVESARGCVDVDLSWSPCTNSLPIRRLGLSVGAASGLVRAAWVRFPELKIEVLPQEYVRIDERRYRYSSNGGAFTAVLDVDEYGLVVEYEGLWRRAGPDG